MHFLFITRVYQSFCMWSIIIGKVWVCITLLLVAPGFVQCGDVLMVLRKITIYSAHRTFCGVNVDSQILTTFQHVNVWNCW